MTASRSTLLAGLAGAILLAILAWLLTSRAGAPAPAPAAPPATVPARSPADAQAPRPLTDASVSAPAPRATPVTDRSVSAPASTTARPLTDASVTPSGTAVVTPGPAADPEGATLFGRVTGPGGAPDAGATVRVWAARESRSDEDDEPEDVAEDLAEAEKEATAEAEQAALAAAKAAAARWSGEDATTDEQGRYRIEGIKPGKQSVHVRSKRFKNAESVPVELAPRQALERDFVLEAGAAIAGRVVDLDKEPVAGIKVEGGWEDREATTDGEGRFRMQGFDEDRQGKVRLEATDPQGTYAPASLEASAGDESVEIVVDLAAAVDGLVVEKGARAPVEGARVDLAGGGGLLDRVDLGDGKVLTDAHGKFTLKGLPSGARTIRVRKEGFAPGLARVDLAAGATHEVLIELGEGALVRGIVRDPDGKPVPGALVVDIPPGGGTGMEAMFSPEALVDLFVSEDRGAAKAASATAAMGGFLGGSSTATDEQGRFELRNLAAGKHTVAAGRAGFVGASVKIAIEGEEAPPEVELRLGLGGSVEGRVVDKDGRPVRGADVAIFSMFGGQKRGKTAPDGTYRISGVRAGTYMAMLQSLGARRPRGPDAPRSVTVEDGKVARLDFGGEMAGAVVAGTLRRGGKPYTRQVMLVRPGAFSLEGMLGAEADEEGRYRIEGVPPGRYDLWLQPNSRHPVEVPEGVKELPLSLDLPALAIRGRVLGAGDAPVEGARVRAVRTSDLGQGFNEAMADPEPSGAGGAFALEDLDDVEYVVEAHAPGYARTRSSPLRPSAGAAAVTIRLSRGGKIRARVVDPEGEPVAGVFLVADDEATGARFMPDMSRGPDFGGSGEAVLEGIPPGTYAVAAVTFQGAFDRRQGVRHTGEGEVAVDLTIGPGGTLVVEARDPSGAPVEGATMDLRLPDGRPLPVSMMEVFASARTSSAGSLRRPRLAPGAYSGTLTAPDGRTGAFQVRIREEEEARVSVVLATR